MSDGPCLLDYKPLRLDVKVFEYADQRYNRHCPGDIFWDRRNEFNGVRQEVRCANCDGAIGDHYSKGSNAGRRVFFCDRVPDAVCELVGRDWDNVTYDDLNEEARKLNPPMSRLKSRLKSRFEARFEGILDDQRRPRSRRSARAFAHVALKDDIVSADGCPAGDVRDLYGRRIISLGHETSPYKAGVVFTVEMVDYARKTVRARCDGSRTSIHFDDLAGFGLEKKRRRS